MRRVNQHRGEGGMERDDYRCRDHEVEPKKSQKKKKKASEVRVDGG